MIETEAIVLHAFDYRETSRIVRLATRELGVISAVARGAKRPKSKFGQGLDLFTSGAAQVLVHPTGDLHNLVAFDATRARPALAGSLERFGAAAALGELCLRFGTDAPATLQEALTEGLDALCHADAETTAATALGTAWRLVAELGFAPSVERCAVCHSELGEREETRFAERVGGAICAACYAAAPGARALPASARLAIRDWLADKPVALADRRIARAHRRLLRGFLEEHLADGRPLRAWASWEASSK